MDNIGRDRAALLPEEHHREGGRGPPLHPARVRRARHLRPRGLLQLPFADGARPQGRGGTLRSLLAGRREHV